MSSIPEFTNKVPPTNGRVSISNTLSPNTNQLFSMYDKIPAKQCVTMRNATEGIWVESGLSAYFFSQSNINYLQKEIRSGVYKASNGQYNIGNQSCDVLKQVMRSIFLQHSVNLPYDITGQIKALNKEVLNYCIPHVYGEAKGYMRYLSDVSTLAVPLELPALASQKNERRALELPKWF
jgi:hypothetical protein